MTTRSIIGAFAWLISGTQPPLLVLVGLGALFLLGGCQTSRPSTPGGGLEWNCADTSEPLVLPLGSVSQAHWHTMETNGEATDFVIYRNEFLEYSPELSPHGRDHIMEIAARLQTTPFPVLVERSRHGRNPALDAARRETVIAILNQLGVHDAACRTVVSQPYNDGISVGG